MMQSEISMVTLGGVILIIHKAVEAFRSVAALTTHPVGMGGFRPGGWTLISAGAFLAQLGLHRLCYLFLLALITPAAILLALIVLQLFILLRLLECETRLAGLMGGGMA